MEIAPMHTFHIPVMGLAFTIDSPIRVAHLGISSVVSLADDDLIEKMNRLYCQKWKLPYEEITEKMQDYRAKRITAYLNTLDEIVSRKATAFKEELLESKEKMLSFLEILPSQSDFKNAVSSALQEGKSWFEQCKKVVDECFSVGNIDVNIMTKLDRENYQGKEQLPMEQNDAHAALRGFAASNVSASVVLSAGLNPRLYAYFEQFSGFYPDENGAFQKKIILKVSDYRSALVQGQFLAKKGLWVSEFRIESGLNCGGHAFATEGLLAGPILNEFAQQRKYLYQTLFGIYQKALADKNIDFEGSLSQKITYQGGVGTAEEHQYLLETFQLDSVGWGSPFLLVPEATSVDEQTRNLLQNASEKDYYRSHISPLGVPFNVVKGMTNDFFKQKRIEDNKAGSACPKGFLALFKRSESENWCMASKKFQDNELQKLMAEKHTLSEEEYLQKQTQITEKACLCVGLANASLLENNLPIKGQQQGVVVCPGPNLAYFDKSVSLKSMLKHIYGKSNILENSMQRPAFFVKELKLYLDYFQEEFCDFAKQLTAKELKKAETFKQNLIDGITFYQKQLTQTQWFSNQQQDIMHTLENAMSLLKNKCIPMH